MSVRTKSKHYISHDVSSRKVSISTQWRDSWKVTQSAKKTLLLEKQKLRTGFVLEENDRSRVLQQNTRLLKAAITATRPR